MPTTSAGLALRKFVFQFIENCLVMFENCWHYNGRLSEYGKIATDVRKLFIDAVKRHLSLDLNGGRKAVASLPVSTIVRLVHSTYVFLHRYNAVTSEYIMRSKKLKQRHVKLKLVVLGLSLSDPTFKSSERSLRILTRLKSSLFDRN